MHLSRFFRQTQRPFIEQTLLVNRQAEAFVAFYEERFGCRLDGKQDSLDILDVVLAEARNSALQRDRKQWLAVHAGAYLFKVASERFREWPLQYRWYHPLEQAVLVVGAPVFKVSLLAEQAIHQRLESRSEIPVPLLFARFEKAVLAAGKGSDELFI
ncbi:hypothetical protein [Chitinophaga sp. YIM B06452]|uniref:hypothetical protein n=1 Tax=Chitinophaga sp. YIM B06452 TaxID=3082158 RepID=UPI0031FECEB0